MTEQAGTTDAIVIGAGFAGLYMVYRLRDPFHFQRQDHECPVRRGQQPVDGPDRQR